MKGKFTKRILTVSLVLMLIVSAVMATVSFTASADDEVKIQGTLTETIKKNNANKEMLEALTAETPYYVLVKHKHMGGSHYAYTDALAETNSSDDRYVEYNFFPGSEMVLVTVNDKETEVEIYEYRLLLSSAGVIRDPDVSTDGKKILFSHKKNTTDDFHIYEMDIATKEVTQLTFGSGHSDVEPKYLPNGNIVFNSNRIVQTVDCWITPVTNLYIMNGDGSNIIRVGYDQVHTTYPTVTSDGRVIYTRWDYNDRTQMWVQALFQMFQDGTNQTEVFGNNSNYPTTLLHTREIPGTNGKYISIASGHHVYQQGELVIVDTNADRNGKAPVSYVYKRDAHGQPSNIDGGNYTTDGMVFKFPYALNENTFLVASSSAYSGSNTKFNICVMDSLGQSVTICKADTKMVPSQIVPIKNREMFNRPSAVNYASDRGTYYVANVYEGEAMKGVEFGAAKYLRVVEIEYRTTSLGATFSEGSGTGDPFSPVSTGNGSWDVKSVLGIVPVEADGSVLFSVPSDTPVYFQLLDENGQMIQTMRSWSTLMPGETFSCVGCHEDKNNVPDNDYGITLAMKKGVQSLQPDIWMGDYEEYDNFDPYKDDAIGFSYLNTVQRVLDENCVVCHSNTDAAISKIEATLLADTAGDLAIGNSLILNGDVWTYEVDGKKATGYAPFGAITTDQKDINTVYSANKIILTKAITVTQYDYEDCEFTLKIKYSGSVNVKVNGKSVYTGEQATVSEKIVAIANSNFVKGANTVTVEVTGGTKYIDLNLSAVVPGGGGIIDIWGRGQTWKYTISNSSGAVSSEFYKDSFDASSWKSGKAPFGNMGKENVTWDDGTGNYIWLKNEFTVSNLSQLKGSDLYFDIFYDDHIVIYINEIKVFDNSGYNTDYEMKIALKNVDQVLKQGKNTIAVKLGDTGGGHFFDMGIKALTKGAADSKAPISFESILISSSRMKRQFPLSYLVLTDSRPSIHGNQEYGVDWGGRPSNEYIKWISSMSSVEVLKPYYAGSTKSNIISMLESGHCKTITDEDIAVISCWIDLCVPCHGEYNEEAVFTAGMQRQYQETVNKRAYFDAIDKYTKASIAGLTSTKEIKIEYLSAKGAKSEATGKGIAIMNYDNKYQDGDKITIKLPEGEKYMFVCLNGRAGEYLVYVPNGTWTYTFENIQSSYPVTMSPGKSNSYRYNTITARIPTADELKAERNLAANVYDLTSNTTSFPHATTSSQANNAQLSGRTAIDGFTANVSAPEKWPNLAWRANSTDSKTSIKIDFGRQVVVNELVIYAANDATHYVSATIELSDGTTMEINMRKTADAMTFDLGGKTVTSITLKNFVKADASANASIAEIQVIGTEK